MKYSFDNAAERDETNAEKYTLREKLFGTHDVLPAWVADMDIDTPECVLDALKRRLEHPIMGYEEIPQSAYLAQMKWMQEMHRFDISFDEIFYSHSVVASMSVAIEAFTNEGDGVIVQTPVYPPFFKTVLHSKRVLVKNPLQQMDDGRYCFDLKDLRSKIDKKTKLLLLCSPHNPVGRVWKQEELEEILNICIQNNIVVFCDEIHSDLVYDTCKHIPFANLSQAAKDLTVTAIGPGKTFNMAGFAISTVVIHNESLRKRFQEVHERVHFAQGATLSHVAFEAAYKDAKEWLYALKEHLMQNYAALQNLCDAYKDFIKLTPIEATYLAWLDCRAMGLKDKELRDFFVQEAKLGLNPGISFGKEGSGFMRLNFAVSSAKMSDIIQRLETGLKKMKRK